MKSGMPLQCQKSILVENASIVIPHHPHHHNTHPLEAHIPYVPPSTRNKGRPGGSLRFCRWLPLSFTTYVYVALILLIMLSQFTQNLTMNRLINIVRGHFSDNGDTNDDLVDDGVGGNRKGGRHGVVGISSLFASLAESTGMKLVISNKNSSTTSKNGTFTNERVEKDMRGKDVDTEDAAMNAPHMTFKFSGADKRLLRRHAVTIDPSKGGSATLKNEQLKQSAATKHIEEKRGRKKRAMNIKRKAVIITVASYDIREMVRNLVCFVSQTTGNAKPIVFALDSNLSTYLRKYKIPSIAFHSDVQVKSANETKTALKMAEGHRQQRTASASQDGIPARWGTQKFSGISNNKLVVAYHVLKQGYDVLLTDVDVMWCRDMTTRFNTFLHDYPDFDMFMQSNRPMEHGTGQLNTGFYYAKSTPGVVELFEGLSKQSPKAILSGQDDQTFFWGFMCRAGHPPTDRSMTGVVKYEDGETTCQWNENRVLLLFLPLMEFPNGAVRFNSSEGVRMKVHPKGFYRDKCRKKEVAMWHVNYVTAYMKRHVMMGQDVWISRDNGSCDTI